MNYKRIYEEFIADRLKLTVEGYTESHHIIPKSHGGSNRKSNLINLSYSDHIFAHELLARIYNTPGMWSAVTNMCSRKTSNKKSRLLLEQARKKHSENMTGKGNPMYGKPGSRLGAKHTDEAKKKISDGHHVVLEDGQTAIQKRNRETAKNRTKENKVNASLKGAKTMRENGLYEARQAVKNETMRKSGKYKTYQIFDTEDVLVFEGILPEMKQWCTDNNGSWYAFEANALVEERLYPVKGSKKYRHLKNYNCKIK